MSSDYGRTERLTNTLITLVVVVVVGVIGWLIYLGIMAGDRNAERVSEQKITCIQSGGVWVGAQRGGSGNTCVWSKEAQ